VGPEADGKLKTRKTPDQEWLHIPANKNVLSDDTLYTRKATATVRLDEDGSTWELLQHTIVRFTKEPSQCPAQKQRRKHVVVAQNERGHITGTFKVRRGETTQVGSEVHTKNAVICMAGTTFGVLYSPHCNTTAVTGYVGTAMVQNPQLGPTSPWVEVGPNELVLVVGNGPPIEPEDLKGFAELGSTMTVVVSACDWTMLPLAGYPGPSESDDNIDPSRRSPVDSLRLRDVTLEVIFLP
jgi:hypothetical protein